MAILSFLSFDDIFLQLFSIGKQTDRTISTDKASGILQDIYKIEECFEMLERYSFVEWKKDQQSYGMHKLVHAWGHDRLTEDEQYKFCVATFKLVLKAIIGCGNSPKDKLRLVPHIMANFTAISDSSMAPNQMTEDTISELGIVGGFLTNIGRLRDGGEMEQFVLNKRRHILGDQHPSTISAMNNLANTLGDLG
jgi:hypothetical protein